MKTHTLPNWKKGFTLIELVVVLSILVIISIVSVVTVRVIERRTLDNASRTLQAEMRRAQRMALIEGTRWRVTFYKQHRRYSIRPLQCDLGRIYIVYLPSGVEFDYLPRHIVDYLPRGTLASPGWGTGTGFTMFLRKNQYVQRLTILPVTGRVRVFGIQRLIG